MRTRTRSGTRTTTPTTSCTARGVVTMPPGYRRPRTLRRRRAQQEHERGGGVREAGEGEAIGCGGLAALLHHRGQGRGGQQSCTRPLCMRGRGETTGGSRTSSPSGTPRCTNASGTCMYTYRLPAWREG